MAHGELWSRAALLFEQALDQPPDRRTEFLRHASGGDEELRSAVASLLAFDDEAAAAPPLPAPPAEESPQVGPYRLVQLLGEGGMGSVWLGERSGDEIRQRVAVKLLSRAGHPALLRLFRRERQILARLEHPNIARFVDGGATPEGIPYAVLEYVQGMPITEFCDARRLGVRPRLELFLKVCGAVQYAHQNLVVHRDLKPRNILVTDEGEPKLLDFGIARPLEPRTATVTLERFLTPAYASPEQLAGRPVSTAADLYSLGVILCELLTGALPDRDALPLPSELATASRAGLAPPEARAALRGTTPRRLRRRLRGDLDQIVAQCLQAEPGNRYATVERLAEDLRNHLLGLPVRARPPHLAYRVRKFVRRHAAGVVAAAVLALALAGGLVQSILHSRDLERERDLARQAEQEAEQVTQFLTDAFHLADPYQRADVGRKTPGEVTVREVLDHSARRVARDFADQPAVRARLMQRLGLVYNDLGFPDQAIPLLRQSLATLRQLHGSDSSNLGEGMIALAYALTAAGRLDEAEPLLHEALAAARKRSPDSWTAAEALTVLGMLYSSRGDLAAAAPALEEALALTHRHQPGSRSAAIVAIELGEVLIGRGELEAAERHLREGMSILRRVAGEEHPDIATALNHLAVIEEKRGHSRAAERLLRRALEMWRRVQGPDHPGTIESQKRLGVFLTDQGDLAAAEALFRDAIARALRKDPKGPDAAIVRVLLADVLARSGRAHEGAVLAEQAIPALRAFSAQSWRVATARSVLGDCLARQGRFAEAEALLLESLPILEDALGPDARNVRLTRERIARLDRARNGAGNTRPPDT
jgi:eukaryotic-like serine/threonine-protein kinase